MVVFTDSVLIMNGEEVTTDFGRTQANVTGRFSIPLDPGQSITETLMFIQIQRIGGFSDGRVQALLNGVKIWEKQSKLGSTAPLTFDSSINRDLIATDGSTNNLEIRVFQGGFDGLNRWVITSQLIYNGNTEEPPTQPPDVEPPIVDPDPTEGDSPPFFDPGSIGDFLFGSTEKIVRTVAVAAVGVGIIIVVPPVAKAITAIKR